MRGGVINRVDTLVGDIGHALQHVGLQQRDVGAGDAEDDRRVVVGGVDLGLVVPGRQRVCVVEDGCHVNLVDAALEVVGGEVDCLSLCGIQSGHIDRVGAIVLEGELLDPDVVHAKAGQSGVAVHSVVVRLEPPGQGDVGAGERGALVTPIASVGAGAVQYNDVCHIDGR